jgi:hypothetical protein
MKPRATQYCLRIPRDAYDDALDIARVFDMSLNQFFLGAIRSFVAFQMQQDATQNAIAKIREARRAGLADGEGERPAEAPKGLTPR